MDANKRIITNTIAQYTKSIINICLSLYSTRLILEALNISDYGVFSVVAGVVGMFGYLANSLVVTTQRYISYYYGAGDKEYVKKVFANSLLVHIIICAIFCAILIPIGNYVVGSFLNIAADRVNAALAVYYVTILMLVMTIGSTPFKALLIAHENIVYISVVEVIDGVLKLALAIVLMNLDVDKLIFYSIMMLVILSLNFMAYFGYCKIKYEESRITFKRNIIDNQCMGQIVGFAGWTTFGMLAGLSQTQGTAIILNKVFGTIMNASFGMASQVNGAIRFVSTSILNAMNPQIMKAEGQGDRHEMLSLAGKESKFSSALMIIISIPLMYEMPSILAFWLKTVPPNTEVFCRALMIAFICDQTTLGLHAANQAMGKIKIYTIATTLPKILLIPIMWGALKLGGSIEVAMACYIAIELLVALFRLPYMHHSANLNIRNYISKVIIPLVPLCVIECVVCHLMTSIQQFPFRFLITGMVSLMASSVAIWFFTFTKSERNYFIKLIKRK